VTTSDSRCELVEIAAPQSPLAPCFPSRTCPTQTLPREHPSRRGHRRPHMVLYFPVACFVVESLLGSTHTAPPRLWGVALVRVQHALHSQNTLQSLHHGDD